MKIKLFEKDLIYFLSILFIILLILNIIICNDKNKKKNNARVNIKLIWPEKMGE